MEDDGAGFDANQERRGLGLRNMRERAAELGGKVAVVSEPGRGTSVVFAVPYAASERGAALWRSQLNAGHIRHEVLMAGSTLPEAAVLLRSAGT